MNFIKEKIPNVPDYIIQDFYYKNLKDATKGEIISHINYYKDINWKLENNFHIGYDIFDNFTVGRLKEREGGSKNPYFVPKDIERHNKQMELLQQQGISKEPIILLQRGDKYELMEGWHRVIQLLNQYPDGCDYPNVYIGSFAPVKSMSHTSANGTTYADYK